MLLLFATLACANGPSSDAAPEPQPEPPSELVEEERRVDLVVDDDGSELYVLLYKKGAASPFAHDHVVEARQVSGSATLDPEDLSSSSVRVEVSVSGLYPDADAMREKVGLPLTVSDNQREVILGHIFEEGQLFLERYDKVAFESTAVSGTAESLEVTGDFTLRGVTRSITVPMAITAEGDGYRAKGGFRIRQSDYGYEPYRALLGALQNEDEVDIVLDVRLKPAP